MGRKKNVLLMQHSSAQKKKKMQQKKHCLHKSLPYLPEQIIFASKLVQQVYGIN